GERPLTRVRNPPSQEDSKRKLGELVGWCERNGAVTYLEDDEDAAWREIQLYMRDHFDVHGAQDVDPMIQRLEVHIKRLALLLAINERNPHVDLAIAKKAVAVGHTYLRPMLEFASDTITNSWRNEIIDEILRLIPHLTEKNGMPPSWAGLCKHSRLLRKDQDEAHRILTGYLVKSGQVLTYIAEGQVVDRYVIIEH
ncbi:MAG: hypothetical protein KJN71_09345, partial [Acidimicrobiia bacterium]|nr:hypothetical protein [Acidimicrobiia bacterium]